MNYPRRLVPCRQQLGGQGFPSDPFEPDLHGSILRILSSAGPNISDRFSGCIVGTSGLLVAIQERTREAICHSVAAPFGMGTAIDEWLAPFPMRDQAEVETAVAMARLVCELTQEGKTARMPESRTQLISGQVTTWSDVGALTIAVRVAFDLWRLLNGFPAVLKSDYSAFVVLIRHYGPDRELVAGFPEECNVDHGAPVNWEHAFNDALNQHWPDSGQAVRWARLLMRSLWGRALVAMSDIMERDDEELLGRGPALGNRSARIVELFLALLLRYLDLRKRENV